MARKWIIVIAIAVVGLGIGLGVGLTRGGEGAPSLSDVVPEGIAPEWNLLLEVPLDPQEIDSQSPVSAAYVRIWHSDNGLVWAAVYQFANSIDAKSGYYYAIAELSNVVQPEPIGDEGVSSTSPLGLQLYLFRQSQYLVTAGSAVLTPNATPPAASLVRELAEGIASRIQDYEGSITSPFPALPQYAKASAFVLSQTKLNNSTHEAHVSSIVLDVPDIHPLPTVIDVEIPLLKEGEQNGNITFRIKIIFLGQTADMCRYKVEVYITKVEGIEDDGDGFLRGAGDLFVAGDISTTCGSLKFITKEIGDFSSGGEPIDFTGGGITDGRFVGSLECEIECEAGVFNYSVVALVRDNDSDDALDMAAGVLRLAGKVPSDYSDEAEGAADAIEEVRKETVQEETQPPNPISKARNVSGDDIGEGNKSGSAELPAPTPSDDYDVE